MTNTEEREAMAVYGIPCGEEPGICYLVGQIYAAKRGPVTRITVTADLPGLHCDMERVRVYDGDAVIFEAPLHNLEGVSYAPPKGE